jgi:hypothetical protein
MSNYDNENGTGLEQQVSPSHRDPAIGKCSKIDFENFNGEKCMSLRKKKEKSNMAVVSFAKIDVICVKVAEKLFLALFTPTLATCI